MFKHVLLPTDGSTLSNKAVKLGLAFAKKINARVTVLHVVPEFRALPDGGIVPLNPMLKKRFVDDSAALAQKLLDAVARQAEARGVKCETISAADNLPYQQIIAIAKKQKCDVIMMASHGRHGLSSLLLGSETAKVLTQAKVPVLVVK
jgi:nucleotide-binding universal stress UspA family protein